MITALIAALAAGSMAPDAAAEVGRTFHYERSNIAGGEEEQIYVHRAAPDRIEVYKMRERCTGAAFVTAQIDPVTGEASKLIAGRLAPGATSRTIGVMEHDAATKRITIRLDLGDRKLDLGIAAPDRPWHLYDYDLATLGAALVARGPDRSPFAFAMAMTWTDLSKPDEFLRWLGRAEAKFAAAETHLGRDTLRFDVTGPAFGSQGGGPIWIDAKDGRIVDVQWGRPNHDGYVDFRLALKAELPRGDAAWRALLTRHFEGCPKD
jgi:hypothetical protein